ncbi:hypothetical protein KKA14_21780 [bacterium]|nr:hypothetical protein [bacterium]
MNRLLTILLFMVVGALFLGSCANKEINPLSLKILETDKQEATFPPSQEELAIEPRLLLSLILYKDNTVTDDRLNQILSFVHQEFEKHGNFTTIPRNQIEALLANEENRRFQLSNVADAIQLGKSMDAAFVAQLQITIPESKIKEGVDTFKANINLTMFRTDSSQVILRKDIQFNTEKYKESSQILKKAVQENFSLRGYILETRGGQQVAKISLGRSMGIQLNREFQVRERIVETTLVEGATRKSVSFHPTALAVVKVIKIMENESWVEINLKDRSKIKKGQVVFSLPDNDNIFL